MKYFLNISLTNFIDSNVLFYIFEKKKMDLDKKLSCFN